MPLSASDKLGPYEILALIGKGGMGEVYRAHDPRTGRDVAIKVSAERFNERFDREVRAVAALNHPNICTLYDVGPNYLVMELVEGESPKGPLPIDEALRIARQIGDALEAAHDKGITHRDLKPANIKIKTDGTVKVLDFGLAKIDPGTAGPQSENSPTLSMAATQMGVILGTAAYMSPEQARGKPVDKRADIWAFGVVLYELISGKRLFQGEDVSHTMAAVIMQEPQFVGIPAQVQRLLKGCLEKDPKRRLRDIGDVWRLLDDPPPSSAAGPERPEKKRSTWLWPSVTGVLVAALVVVEFLNFRERLPESNVVRFDVAAPQAAGTLGLRVAVAVSPDGKQIALAAPGAGGRDQLWVHSFESNESKALAGTDDVQGPPFWSADSRSLAYEARGKLRRVDLAGGPPQSLTDVGAPAGRGGAWSPQGVIIFGGLGNGLMSVPATGGAASPLTAVDTSRQELGHAEARFLPDGRHFLYGRFSGVGTEGNGIYIGSLDAKPEQQSTKRLVASDSGPWYAPSADSSAGYVLFTRGGSLMAQPFDAGKLELRGDAVPIAEGLVRTNVPPFSVSLNGVLAYRAGGPGRGAIENSQLSWFDREGKVLGTVGQPDLYFTLSLSPDGTRAAVAHGSLQDVTAGRTGPVSRPRVNLWIHDLARGTSNQLTFDSGQTAGAMWSPDGTQIIFGSDREGGVINLYRKSASGAGNEELLLKSPDLKFTEDWSRDGRFLLYSIPNGRGGQSDLWKLPLEGKSKEEAYLNTESDEEDAKFSPDGSFVAYTSTASAPGPGSPDGEVYVRPFPDPSKGQWKISEGGGHTPRWRRDGKEIYYISKDSKMMAVEVSMSPVFNVGLRKVLFAIPRAGSPINFFDYGVTADGKKFLIVAPAQASPAAAEAGPPPIKIIMNWQGLLKK